MDYKQISSILFNFIQYLFAFLLLFFIIYRAYIYCFDLKPHPCMSDKCINDRRNIYTGEDLKWDTPP